PHSYRYDLHIDPSDVLLSHQGDHDTGQLAVGIFGIANGKLEDGRPVLFNVNLTSAQHDAALKDGIAFSEAKTLPAGTASVRIVVLDLGSAEAGALTIPVPAP